MSWIIPSTTLRRGFGQRPLGYLVSLASFLASVGSPCKAARYRNSAPPLYAKPGTISIGLQIIRQEARCGSQVIPAKAGIQPVGSAFPKVRGVDSLSRE
jgi:hypothetical protein